VRGRRATIRAGVIPGVVAASVVIGCAIPADGRFAGDLAREGDGSPRAEAPSDPAYHAAVAALAARRPWRAEAIIAPALADSAGRPAWAVLVAAQAAGASGRWPRVDSLLAGSGSASTLAYPRARLLLARSALEGGRADAALVHARAAYAVARGSDEQGEALVFAARALERLGLRDSARATYGEAATRLVTVGDWLALRAATLTPDSAARAVAYRRIWVGAARRRAIYAEAQLLEQLGKPRAAIPLYERVGAPMQAMRLRAATARGRRQRGDARRELVSFVAAASGTDNARSAIEMLDEGGFALTPAEEITVARSAAEHGPLSRARTGVPRALRDRTAPAEERLAAATILASLGPDDRTEAERTLARTRWPSSLAGRAALERARLARAAGRGRAAEAAFRRVVTLHPRDTAAASGALLALAEMATDARRPADARTAYLALARRYPTSEHAARAGFNAAILAFGARKYGAAAEELDAVAARYPAAADASAARYWSGRAHAALHDSSGARARWRALLAADSLSYYADRAALRLGNVPWAPPAAADAFLSFPDMEEGLVRADLLARLGMALEARLELDALAARADSSIERTLALGNAARARGQQRRAMELGRRAIALGATDARAWRLVYPVGEADLVAREAAGRGADPALVAAVIRQESGFEPRATSAVGARGLMQVMPVVAEALARAERIDPWDPERLYDPDVNIRLGVAHLRSFTRYYPDPALALAAYNAGPGRVARWRTRGGAEDPELFVERIRFTETRGYVRTVLRSRALYAALYDWGGLARGD
jgi:soluble lytic murein transglycosylase